ncbi:MAG: glycosyltransferase family 2 protein [Pseudomonadota bacterium]
MASPTDTPLVSVILPTWNRAALLPRSAGSVLTQAGPSLELIIVDDGSTDDTEAVVRALGDDRIRYLCRDHRGGGAAARNTGLAAARAHLVAFQDSDDEWRPDKLERQFAALQSQGPETRVVYTGFDRVGPEGAEYIPNRDRFAKREGDLLRALQGENFISTQTLLAPRALLVEIGGFDEALGRFQDWDLALRLARRTRFALLDEPLVTQHVIPGSITSDGKAGLEALTRITEKNLDVLQEDPAFLAARRTLLGHQRCLGGDPLGARIEFRRALAATPGHPRALAGLLLSRLGSWGYRRALGFLGRETGPI